jgi:hypothetical protein
MAVLGEVYSIHQYLIKFVSDLRQSVGSPVSSTNKTDHHDTTEVLLKVALHTVAIPNKLGRSWNSDFWANDTPFLRPVD